MSKDVQITTLQNRERGNYDISFLNEEVAENIHAYHASFPMYENTPLVSDEIREKLGEVTFITATDGNHGRGVAWTANQLKQKSIVYMPKVPQKKEQRIFANSALRLPCRMLTMMSASGWPMT